MINTNKLLTFVRTCLRHMIIKRSSVSNTDSLGITNQNYMKQKLRKLVYEYIGHALCNGNLIKTGPGLKTTGDEKNRFRSANRSLSRETLQSWIRLRGIIQNCLRLLLQRASRNKQIMHIVGCIIVKGIHLNRLSL